MEDGPGVRALGQAGRPADPGRQAGRRGVQGRARSPHGPRVEAVNPSGHGAAPTRWPAWTPGYGFAVPLLAGDHVTDDAGTGFVHTAPGHGADDYEVWLAHGHHEIPDTVDPDGAYYDARAPVRRPQGAGDRGQEGRQVRPGQPRGDGQADRGRRPAGPRPDGALLSALLALQGPGDLPQHAAVVHPHGRAAGRRRRTLRETALDAIDATAFHPAAGRNRIRSMVESRPDWLISRQRAWGTPLAMFVDKADRPAAARRRGRRPHRRGRSQAEGADAWFTRPDTDFLGEPRPGPLREDRGHPRRLVRLRLAPTPSPWRAAHDTQLARRPLSRRLRPAPRLVPVVACWRAAAPAAARPMTPSSPTASPWTRTARRCPSRRATPPTPQTVIKRVRRRDPAPVGRRWSTTPRTSGSASTILQTTVDAYRKLRNTVRYLLGALAGFDEAERLPLRPDAAAGAVHPAPAVGAGWPGARAPTRPTASRTWCGRCWSSAQNDLSALYLRHPQGQPLLRPPGRVRRRAARTVMDAVFERLTAWLAPLTPFTMEEAWTTRFPDAGSNCAAGHPGDAGRVAQRRRGRALGQGPARCWRSVNDALEAARRDKPIGGALDAWPLGHGARGRHSRRSTAWTPPRCSAPRAPTWRSGETAVTVDVVWPTTPNAAAAGAACPTSANPAACAVGARTLSPPSTPGADQSVSRRTGSPPPGRSPPG